VGGVSISAATSSARQAEAEWHAIAVEAAETLG
jgi:hypothetical protein